MNWEIKYGIMVEYMEKMGAVLVAFSGGVDSSLLLAAAMDALGRERVLAVTAVSPIHPPEELEDARRVAEFLGARWRAVESAEMQNPQFVANPPQRCYFCKRDLLALLAAMAEEEGISRIVEGSNINDLEDYRPGFRAVSEAGVTSPLLEAGLTKEDVRKAARERGIPSWNRPSDACLCSRIPYGSAITEERLRRIYLAEKVVKGLGVEIVRVRDHGEIARIEVPERDIEIVCRAGNRLQVVQKLNKIGFKYVTVDIGGYRTGSMN
ncbi:MAG: ATP-dependent sacrificial sulfur transferase LarE [Bacillota bacterium]